MEKIIFKLETEDGRKVMNFHSVITKRGKNYRVNGFKANVGEDADDRFSLDTLETLVLMNTTRVNAEFEVQGAKEIEYKAVSAELPDGYYAIIYL